MKNAAAHSGRNFFSVSKKWQSHFFEKASLR